MTLCDLLLVKGLLFYQELFPSSTCFYYLFTGGHSFSTYAQKEEESSESVRHAYKGGGGADTSKYVSKKFPFCMSSVIFPYAR